MHSESYETLIHKHLAGTLTDAEQRSFSAWLEASPANRQQVEEAERIWSLVASDEPAIEVDVEAEIKRFKQRIDFGSAAPSRSLHLWQYAAAAVLLIGAVLLVLQFSGQEGSQVSVMTQAGETEQVVLPDGSSVWLNENSRLSYAKSLDVRTVTLEGEAFFDVQHDAERPFTIDTAPGLVEVLGTSFNVVNRASDAELHVTVATGRVRLSLAGTADSETLTPGFVGSLHKTGQTIQRRPNGNPDFLPWRDRSLSFSEASFEDVLEGLSAHFAIVIATPDPALLSCTFTGTFDNPNLQDVLDALEFSLGFSTTVSDRIYAFSGMGCS